MEKILICGYLTYGCRIQFFLLGWGKHNQDQSYWFFPVSDKLHITDNSFDIQETMDSLITVIKNNIKLLKASPPDSADQTFASTRSAISTLDSSAIDWESLLDSENFLEHDHSFSYDTPKETEETKFDIFSDELPKERGTIVSKQYYLKKGKAKNLLHEYKILQKLKGLSFFPQGTQ